MAQGLTTPLTCLNSYSLNTLNVSTTFSGLLTDEPYSKISGDFNPIHVSPYFTDFTSLPATITHGMWSSVATRCYVDSIVAQGHPDRMIACVMSSLYYAVPVPVPNLSFYRYDVEFVDMVLPGDELTVKLRHIDMRDGTLSLTSKPPMPGAKRLYKVQRKFLSQALSMSSLAKVPKNSA